MHPPVRYRSRLSRLGEAPGAAAPIDMTEIPMLFFFLAPALGAADVDITLTDATQRLSPQPSVPWTPRQCPATSSLQIDLQAELQVIGGFGASMTESSAVNLNSLPNSKQEELLELIFGDSGARLSAMKATMLSNDFSAAAPWSTYDDSPGDISLANFSIARDLRLDGSLTLIKRAIDAGFDTQTGTIQAYMDYPPDWMLIGQLPGNATVDPKYYDALALYYAKYVQAYASHGVPIHFLEAFNEPTDSYTKMSAEQLATFLGQHLGPTFDKLGLHPQTKLSYGGQALRSTALEFVPKVMSNDRARYYMDVIAYHGYDCQFNCTDDRENYDAIAKLHQARAHMHTSTSGLSLLAHHAVSIDHPNMPPFPPSLTLRVSRT